MQRRLRFILFGLLIFVSFHGIAQYKYSASLGASNERLNNAPGTHARLFYNFSDNFRMYVEFVRYFEVEEQTETNAFAYDYRDLNLALSYSILFGEKENFGIYALLGFNYNYGRQVSINETDTNERFLESPGMTFGIGASYKFGRFQPYIESRTVATGSRYYLVHSLGLAFMFGKLPD